MSLIPKAQPPPKATLILLFGYLANKGPIVKTPALIVETKLYGTINLCFLLFVILIIFFSFISSTFEPKDISKSFMVKTSFTKGAFLKITFFLNKIEAAIKGKQEFLAPLTFISPLTPLLGPFIKNLFIYFDFARVIPTWP